VEITDFHRSKTDFCTLLAVVTDEQRRTLGVHLGGAGIINGAHIRVGFYPTPPNTIINYIAII